MAGFKYPKMRVESGIGRSTTKSLLSGRTNRRDVDDGAPGPEEGPSSQCKSSSAVASVRSFKVVAWLFLQSCLNDLFAQYSKRWIKSET